MLSRMKEPEKGGSRVAIVMNGSPLFTGDAGSGESEIRRWILENDWLEAIVALPEQLFYNTGIATYVWVLTNHKKADRKGKVQLINATTFWVPMRKSLGDKRREISKDHIEKITKLFTDFTATEITKIFKSTDFGYRKITVERPLRLNFQASNERIERIRLEKIFQNLTVSKKKDPKERMAEEIKGREQQDLILAMLHTLPPTLLKDQKEFDRLLTKVIKDSGIKLTAALKKSIYSALSERDEAAEVCRDADGKPEADSELRDTENVPLSESIQVYFDREVKPHVPDAWINTAVVDQKDGKTGKVGYEINFNRYFYKYVPPRPLEEIEADIRKVEDEITELLKEVVR
jgi:type I restriction enzyme M protein